MAFAEEPELDCQCQNHNVGGRQALIQGHFTICSIMTLDFAPQIKEFVIKICIK